MLQKHTVVAVVHQQHIQQVLRQASAAAKAAALQVQAAHQKQ